MKRGVLLFGLGCLLCLVSIQAGNGASGLFVMDETIQGYADGWFDLSEHTDLLPDPDGTLTFEEVSSAVYSNQFQPYSVVESRGYDPDVRAYWVRLTLLCDLERCPRCVKQPRGFTRHDTRRRTFLVLVGRLVHKVLSVIDFRLSFFERTGSGFVFPVVP